MASTTGEARASNPVQAWAAPLAATGHELEHAAITLKRRRPYMAYAGFLALAIIFAMAIFGPLLTRHEPNRPNTQVILQGPSAQHWMGTDQFGRDVFSRVVHAARLDLRIAFSITALALVSGAIVGGLIGFYGGWLDLIAMRVIDVLLAFPGFILALGITAMLGNTVQNVIIAVAIAYFPYFVRIVRGEMLALREAEFAAAATCVGVRKLAIMMKHLLPNALPPALVQATLTLGWGILDTAGLSFLGVGIRPPTPEWGVLIGDGAKYISYGQWWISVFPGFAILLAVAGFNLTGDWLRDRLEKRP